MAYIQYIIQYKSVKSHVSAKYAYLMRRCDFFLGVGEFFFTNVILKMTRYDKPAGQSEGPKGKSTFDELDCHFP